MLEGGGGGVPGIKICLNDEYKAKDIFMRSSKYFPTLMHCWPYLDFDSLYKHQDDIRRIIRPKPEWLEEAKKNIERIRKNFLDCILVGVHIRRKDYKDFLGGRYYYNYDVYRTRMEEFTRNFNRKPVFIIFSDEEIDIQLLANDDAYYTVISHNQAIIDLVMMSFCDYLIGPPSTFSGWASFWGKVPKHIMINGETPILSLQDFGVYMIDIMDNEEDKTGRKIITRFFEGKIQERLI